MNEQQIRNLIRQTLQSSSNFTVPRHTHNGVDMIRVNSYDIATSNPQGFVFNFGVGTTTAPVNIVADIPNNEMSILYFPPTGTAPLVNFNIAEFKNIFLLASGTSPGDSILATFDDGTNEAILDLSASSVELFFTDGSDTTTGELTATKMTYGATGDFALGLPDLLSLPATCNTGELTVQGGQLYLCSPNNTWTLITTATTNGIVSINADTTAAQTLSVGTSGVDFNITDPGGGSHVFNLPTASALNRGALSSADWTTFNNKLSSSLTTNHIFIGVAGVATDVAMSGDATIVASGALTLATVNSNVGTFGSATQVPQFTVNAKGLITAVSNVTITGTTPGGAAGGDLSGTYPNPTVAKINGVALGSTTATSGNLLIADGSQWVTKAMSGDATITSGGVITIANQAVTYAKMQNISASPRLLGRASAGAGSTEEISLGGEFVMKASNTTLYSPGASL